MKKENLFCFEVDRRTIGKSAVSSVLVQLLTKLKGIVTMPIITLLMAPADLGTFNLILVTSSFLTPFVTMNLTDGVGILFAQEKDITAINRMYNTIINLVAILVLAFLVLSLGLRNYFSFEFEYWVLLCLLVVSNISYKLPLFLLATYQNSGLILINVFYKDLTVTLFTIITVYLGYAYIGMVVSLVVFQSLFSLVLFKKIYSVISYRPEIDKILCKKFLVLSLPLLPVFFFSWLVQSSDSYFLAYYSGTDTVGKYSIVYGITNIILSITFALNFFWFPVSARLWMENRPQYMKVFTGIFVGMFTLLMTLVCLFELNSAAIMKIFIRRTAYHDAHIIMGTIAFAFAMQVLITLLTAPLYSNKNTTAILVAYLSGGICNGALNFLLIPQMGIVGAAVSTAVAYLLIVVVMGCINYRLARFSFIDPRLKYVIPASVAAWASMGWLRGYLSVAGTMVADITFVMAVAVCVYRLGMRSEERDYVMTWLRSFRRNLRQVQGA